MLQPYPVLSFVSSLATLPQLRQCIYCNNCDTKKAKKVLSTVEYMGKAKGKIILKNKEDNEKWY